MNRIALLPVGTLVWIFGILLSVQLSLPVSVEAQTERPAGSGGVAVQPSQAQSPGEPTERPDALFAGEPIYGSDYLLGLRAQTYDIHLQEYRLKLQALKNFIDTRLLKEEAEALGISQKELVEREILVFVTEPDESAVEQRFAQSLFSMGQGTKTREDIRNDIRREQMGVARERYFSGLRERAGVRILLPRPRIQVDTDPARVRGNPEAPITIVEFSDFECPHCVQATGTVKNLLSRYEGKVSLSFRDLPLLQVEAGATGPGSADAARCAQEQGKFWEYHDVLFDTQSRGLDAYLEYAEQLGMELDPFNECLTSGRYAEAIKADFADGISLGIRGTPYFFINGIPLDGARPEADFAEIIEEELALLE